MSRSINVGGRVRPPDDTSIEQVSEQRLLCIVPRCEYPCRWCGIFICRQFYLTPQGVELCFVFIQQNESAIISTRMIEETNKGAINQHRVGGDRTVTIANLSVVANAVIQYTHK